MIYKVITVLAVATLILLWTGDEFDGADIKGRNVVITGASAGIGESLAYQYAKLGANVFITARRENLLKQVVKNCKAINPTGRFGYYVADMKKYKTESQALIQKAVQLLHGIDTLIVNHVYYGHMTAWHGTDKELDMFEDMTAIDFNSYVHIASHAFPHLKNAIIGRLGIISSIAGKVSVALLSTYSGCKFGLDGFFSTIRDELQQAKSNVTVTLAVLGRTLTETTEKIRADMADRLGRSNRLTTDISHGFFATSEEAAIKVMEATETGTKELYYPFWFKSNLVTYPSAWTAILQHIWSRVTEATVYSETFYRSQEPV